MIDKEKTLHKAISRYHDIFPARGKHSLNDCFFRLRGEHVFVFMTKDKKVHTMRAEVSRPVSIQAAVGRETLGSLFKAMNKPIIVRSLIIGKPVGTWLINLFPSPGISWSDNRRTSSGPARTYRSDCRDGGHGTAPNGAGWMSETGDTSTCSYPPAYPVQNGLRREPGTFDAQPRLPQRAAADYRCEILATGYLPVHPVADWMPAPDEYTLSYPATGAPYPSPTSPFDRLYMRQPAPTACRYEILATGRLPVHPFDWMPAPDMGPE